MVQQMYILCPKMMLLLYPVTEFSLWIISPAVVMRSHMAAEMLSFLIAGDKYRHLLHS